MTDPVSTKVNEIGLVPLLTAREVAEYLNVTEAAVYNWVKEGRGPRSHRVGRRMRFRREDVDAWLESRAAP